METGRKSNVYKMFRKRPRRLLHVLSTFNICPVSRGLIFEIMAFPQRLVSSKSFSFFTLKVLSINV